MSSSRRDFLRNALGALMASIAGAWPSLAGAMGEEDQLELAWLLPADDEPVARKTALRRLLQEIEKRTSVKVNAESNIITLDRRIFDYPMLFLSGSGSFDPWSDEQIDLLRTWLKGGGFLVVDSHEGIEDGPFLRDVKRELARVYPDEEVKEIPANHVLYKSFYLISTPYGRLATSDKLHGYFEQDRVPVVLSANDMLGAWARDGFGRWEFDVIPQGEQQREYAIRLGVNLVMYALCVNYKEDQVHIQFLMKRRNWKVN